jgi:hypothetical protein
MRIVASIIGTAQVARSLYRIKKEMPAIMGRGLYRAGNRIMTLSKENYVPIDTGFLKSTGVVDLPRLTAGGMEVQLKYSANYAVYVHERLNVAHPHGQAKYLEAAMILAKQQRWLEKDLAEAMMLALGKN